jgi:hypothetical protein
MSGPKIPRPPYDPSTHSFCTKCRQVKVRAAFPRNKRTRDGLHYWCLDCNNGGARTWALTPVNYRRRRDLQALNARRYSGSKLEGPVKARYMLPPHLRQEQTC